MTAVVAKARVAAYFKPEGENADFDAYKHGDKVIPYRIVGEWKGTDLVGMHYKQLMPWVKPTEKVEDNSPAWVSAYAAAHPDKCFTSGIDEFVELAEEASVLSRATM